MIKEILKSVPVQRTLDLILSPLTLVAAIWFKFIRLTSARSMPVSDKIFMKIGVLPVPDHYYQPLINPGKHLEQPLYRVRTLPGIDWNVEEQLALLAAFDFNEELKAIPVEKKDASEFQYYYNNHSYRGGDGSYLYNMIRQFKPKRVIEIGCGFSTMMARAAEKRNEELNPADGCEHICIEPYEMPWLEKLNITVIREKVESVPESTFASLEANDILFIDSSHIIRPQGDVLFEFLELLPQIKPGVIVHVHDIFSPRDYLKDWIFDKHLFWNEQYILEAFLTLNKEFRIIGALNYLKHHHRAAFEAKCEASLPDDQPGSFWMIRN